MDKTRSALVPFSAGADNHLREVLIKCGSKDKVASLLSLGGLGGGEGSAVARVCWAGRSTRSCSSTRQSLPALRRANLLTPATSVARTSPAEGQGNWSRDKCNETLHRSPQELYNITSFLSSTATCTVMSRLLLRSYEMGAAVFLIMAVCLVVQLWWAVRRQLTPFSAAMACLALS